MVSKSFLDVSALSRLTYDQAEFMYLEGRMTYRDWRRFNGMFDWAAPRFSGTPARRQDRYANRHGIPALTRRFNRVRRVIGLQPYPV